jgi:rubredoxin
MTNGNGDHTEPDRDDRTHYVCPKCGENRIDYLVWIDDDKVRCSICGTEYEPGADEA